jgi:uncharacterized protein
MQYNVASLLQESTGASRTFEIDDDVRIDGETHHLSGTARLDRTPRGVLVRAHVAGKECGECSRCLRPIAYPVEIAIEEEYIPTIDINTGAHVDAPEDDQDAYRINARHIIDLNEAVRQYWEIAMPMAPVCSDDCPGICAACGEMIAASGHECTADQSDARWSKLADLRL